ncbi:MAG TPA: hypothetical protein VKP88_06265 [Candidatus Paceibacterota bacterium]|nr:hypothetical protein [Candidatus Paceibacterota bacterium]
MLKNLFILLGLLATVGIGYYLFVIEDQALRSGNADVVSDAEQESRDFLRRLEEIQRIEIQTEVLTDPRFNNRVDYSRAVPTIPAGRENPFVPATDSN